MMILKLKMVGNVALAAAVLVGIRPSLGVAEVQGDMSGTWTVTFTPPAGDRITTWEIEQHDDGTLTGKIGLFNGISEPANDGWVEDGAFGFSVTRNLRGQIVKTAFTGTVVDNSLEGHINMMGFFTATFTGVRAGGDEDAR